MTTTDDLKYPRIEYGRKFLVPANADWLSAIEPYSKTLDDKYLRDARLRLRLQTDNDSGRRVIKLTKKSESPSPYFRTISRILLSPVEYELLSNLEGDRLKKVRHYDTHHQHVFWIDRFEGELEGLILCETEAEGLEELMSLEAPAYTSREVTEDEFFTGGSLSRTTRAELRNKLATLA